MTNEEAHKLLTNRQKCRETDCQSGECYGCECQWDASREDEAEAVAIEALEMQIPKKVEQMVPDGCFLCPSCGNEVQYNSRYCHLCGQRLE